MLRSLRVRHAGPGATPSHRVIAAVATLALALAASGCGGGGGADKAPAKPSGKDASATAPAAAAVAPTGDWPAKVAEFATKVKGPVWYPSAVPEGLAVDALDVLELEPGTGLVCDILFVGGSTEVGFTQGSPKTREYDLVSVGKVAWGSETADVIYEDPEDTSSPRMIVYDSTENLAELYGGASFDQLKAIAASMVVVK